MHIVVGIIIAWLILGLIVNWWDERKKTPEQRAADADIRRQIAETKQQQRLEQAQHRRDMERMARIKEQEELAKYKKKYPNEFNEQSNCSSQPTIVKEAVE